ncbi:TauD/TfdA family dioxygenase [Streptomyces sp. NPDC015532]|uniref:TauD/TfdA family dioxygenase n=1 Tax=Streptomyces sp. NPDC015532 TaxID=3364960 RepID=UPI0036F8464F
MDSTTDTDADMRRSAADARCPRTARAPYLEKLQRHGFVVLEPQGPDPVPLEDVMAPLGGPTPYSFGTQLIQEQRPGTDNSQFRTGAIPMHTDALLNANPVSYIGLECLQAPDEGGETLVAGSRAFFATAPTALVDTLRGIEIEYWSRVSGFYVERPDGNPVVAPVQVDPVTGGDALWIGLDHPADPHRNYGAAVIGYTGQQNRDLFAALDRALNIPEVTYAHRWRPGQILIMDNRRVLHARTAYSPESPRRLRRISVT